MQGTVWRERLETRGAGKEGRREGGGSKGGGRLEADDARGGAGGRQRHLEVQSQEVHPSQPSSCVSGAAPPASLLLLLFCRCTGSTFRSLFSRPLTSR